MNVDASTIYSGIMYYRSKCNFKFSVCFWAAIPWEFIYFKDVDANAGAG